jgi:3-deoxy-manno-octulosonate cytidylyltransferase (CMP-KDO synthetase)
MSSIHGVLGVIPARLNSTRLPKKVILPINGKPMIQHIYESAVHARCFDEVVIATDSNEVVDVAKAFKAKALLTPDLNSGTDRVAFVAREFQYPYIVNIQGDEPLIKSEQLNQLTNFLKSNSFDLTTLITKSTDSEKLQNPNCVKVVKANSGEALYFSRKPINQSLEFFYLHIGIYAYKRDALFKFCRLPQSSLEITEKLEQLRGLQNGLKIGVMETAFETIAVDTQEDLEKVERRLHDAKK